VVTSSVGLEAAGFETIYRHGISVILTLTVDYDNHSVTPYLLLTFDSCEEAVSVAKSLKRNEERRIFGSLVDCD